MILLLDCGNTLIKYAWFNNGIRSPSKTLAYTKLDELPNIITHQPKLILGATVQSPKIKTSLENLSKSLWDISINWCDASDGRQFMHTEYANSLGADRWLGALGLLQQIKNDKLWQAGHPYILTSFGTATTIDTIRLMPNQQACFLGGLILPGIELMRTSLANGTAGLPHAKGQSLNFPLDTHNAIYSGIIASQCGALYRQFNNAIKLSGGLTPQIYICGGAWHLIKDSIDNELNNMLKPTNLKTLNYHLIDSPVLNGLTVLAPQN